MLNVMSIIVVILNQGSICSPGSIFKSLINVDLNVMFRIFILYLTLACVSVTSDDSKRNEVAKPIGDSAFLALPRKCDVCETELDSIKALHKLLDDDENGSVDQAESDEFIRDELKYTDGFERQSKFHGGDKLISVEDLWRVWKESPVYNWTVDDVLEWLVVHVELGQYAEAFKNKGVNGSVLPRCLHTSYICRTLRYVYDRSMVIYNEMMTAERVAVNSNHFLSGFLGIKNTVHKQKLSLKAVDIVLFGPPKKGHSYIKDLALILSLVVAFGGCWFAYSQYRYSQSQVKRMNRDLDSLQRAEDNLVELQNKLDLAEQSHRSVAMEKENLKQQFSDEISTAKQEAARLQMAREGTMEEISRMKLAEEELKQVRLALLQAETHLETRPIPSELQPWLQLCHEMELKHYQAKRTAAERQLSAVRDECQKMRKKRSSFVSTIRSTSIDDIDKKIASARAAFDEVRHDLQERQHRWATIEYICKFAVVQNHGLPYLCSLLQRDINSYGTVIVNSGMSGATGPIKSMPSLDSIDDDLAPLPSLKSIGHHHGSVETGNSYGGSWTSVKRSASQYTNLSSASDTSSPTSPVKFDLDDSSMHQNGVNDNSPHPQPDTYTIHSTSSAPEPLTKSDENRHTAATANNGVSHKVMPRRSATMSDLNCDAAGSADDLGGSGGDVVRSNTFSQGNDADRGADVAADRRKPKKKKYALLSFRKKEKTP